MSLLQISEPKQSPDPHRRRFALGIDLGTTHSLVAVCRSGKSEVLAVDGDDRLLPSAVYYGGGAKSALTGKDAYAFALSDPKNTIVSAKRFMGRSKADIKFSHPYQLQGDDGNMPDFVTDKGAISPVAVSAALLWRLAQTAKQALPGGHIEGAVITVPAYFDEAQRQATVDAAKAAGIHVLRLLNEPTAAAIAYGLDKSLTDRVVLVYDLGGGTFDVSLLALKDGVFEVLATGGNSALGGDDVDRLIAHYLAKQSGKDLNGAQKSTLAKHAKQYKQALSDCESVEVDLPDFGIKSVLDRQSLARIGAPVIDRANKAIAQVLRDAGLTTDDVDDVILVGGSTRMPAVIESVRDFFGKAPLQKHNPDEVVALGAALLADQLVNPKNDKMLLLDVTPLSLGIETMGGLVETIIPRNTPIPITKQQEFTTYQDGQTGMIFHVVQGERDTAAHCRSLARFRLSGIPPMKAGLARVQLRFSVDVNGQLTVQAKELSAGVEASVRALPANGLSEKQQEALLKAGFEHAQEDKKTRALIEAQVAVKKEADAVDAALQEFAELLDADEKAELARALDDARSTLASNDKATLDRAAAALKTHADRFAAKIMNASVKTALTGTLASDWQKS